jgi:MFS superfamily sulfate permease-like transporter
MFALVGTVESLLTVKAIDSLDAYKRKSNYNKDLIAVGIGNIFVGSLGGLPMISEVARSSANVNNGAQTRWANFFHGLFLLIAVLTIAPIIELIPNAALAAMLIAVGYRLASPNEFIKTYKIGKSRNRSNKWIKKKNLYFKICCSIKEVQIQRCLHLELKI